MRYSGTAMANFGFGRREFVPSSIDLFGVSPLLVSRVVITHPQANLPEAHEKDAGGTPGPSQGVKSTNRANSNGENRA